MGKSPAIEVVDELGKEVLIVDGRRVPYWLSEDGYTICEDAYSLPSASLYEAAARHFSTSGGAHEVRRIAGHAVECSHENGAEVLRVDGARQVYFKNEDGYTLSADAYSPPSSSLFEAAEQMLRGVEQGPATRASAKASRARSRGKRARQHK